MKSAVTVSLVPEARDGPFVFWNDLPSACATAARLGFAGVEIFPPSADTLDEHDVRGVLARHGLTLAAVGTGAGWVKHRLTLTSGDESVRRRAWEFVEAIVDAAGALGAPAVIGSMQGRSAAEDERDRARGYLREALDLLGDRAARFGVPLVYEPLNRYETNLVNTVASGVAVLQSLSTKNVRLLADLFHMNIEETEIPAAIRAGGPFIGHVHLADSNRRPAGYGHTDFGPIAAALREIDYNGYVSAEALPLPDSRTAAEATMNAFNRYFRF